MDYIPHRPFNTIVPPAVFEAKISGDAKLLYGVIYGLATSEGYAWASNEYLSEAMSASVRKIQRQLSSLKKLGFIKIQVSQRPYRNEDSHLRWKSDRKIWITGGLEVKFKKFADMTDMIPSCEHDKNGALIDKECKSYTPISQKVSQPPDRTSDPGGSISPTSGPPMTFQKKEKRKNPPVREGSAKLNKKNDSQKYRNDSNQN